MRRLAAAILILAASSLRANPPAADFAPRFYRSGEAGRAVEAQIEGSPGSFEASLFPCSGCHCASGEGRREGGTQPADIRWSRLRAAGYDGDAFCRAVTTGRRPAGDPLARAMPRYLLEREECAALWLHLRGLEEDLPPGVDEDEIRIGVSMKAPSPARLAWRGALAAELAAANLQGGVYGRRLRLVDGPATAAIRVLVDGELPAAGESPGTLLVSVPPPRGDARDWELWQVETPRERQLRLIAADASSWRVVRGGLPAAEEAAALFADAAADAAAVVEKEEGCAPAGGPRHVLALFPDPEALPRLRRLDACAGERRFLLLEPALPLAAFEDLRHPYYLVVPFDPGPERDLHAGARILGRALVAALVGAGRRLRQPRLAEELSRAFAERGGEARALFGGLLLLPREEQEEARWLGSR